MWGQEPSLKKQFLKSPLSVQSQCRRSLPHPEGEGLDFQDAGCTQAGPGVRGEAEATKRLAWGHPPRTPTPELQTPSLRCQKHLSHNDLPASCVKALMRAVSLPSGRASHGCTLAQLPGEKAWEQVPGSIGS